MEFQDIKLEFDEEHESRKWSIGTESWDEYRKEHALKNAALQELKNIFNKVGEKQFLSLVIEALSINNGICSPVEILEKNEELKEKYSLLFAEFNRQFISTHLVNIPINCTMKFLANSLSKNNISKDFIDAVKLSPNIKNGLWQSIKTRFSKNEPEDKKDNWYDVKLEEQTVIDEIKTADYLSLIGNVENAIKIYKHLIDRRFDEVDVKVIQSKIILSSLSVDVIDAQRYLEQYPECENVIFLKELTSHVINYDITKYVESVRKVQNINSWSTTMFLRIKNQII